MLGPWKVEPPHVAVPDSGQLRDMIGEMTENSAVTKRQALKELSLRLGVSVNALYKLLED
jgi:hypothetical protein